MSHPSKVDYFDRANKAGYKTHLYFVCTEASSINIERVKNRMEKGGQAVPTEKIVSRYLKSLALLPQAVSLA